MSEELTKLREPFPAESIDQIPRAGIKLDYVGHAWITERLLDVDLEWSWEPVAFTEQGSPLISIRGDAAVMWIRLTVCGVTRLGVGTAKANKDELEKELISDALRNAAMRFGAALDLWKKTDNATEGAAGTGSGESSGPRQATDKQRKMIEVLVNQRGLVPEVWPLPDDLTMKQASAFIDKLQAEPKKDETVVRRGPDPDAVAALETQLGAEAVA